jgi:arylsulfatase A-like enzyme
MRPVDTWIRVSGPQMQDVHVQPLFEAVDSTARVKDDVPKGAVYGPRQERIVGTMNRREFLRQTGVAGLLGLASLRSAAWAAPAKARGAQAGRQPPNVVFFAFDDLCDWVQPLGYNQAKTPNLLCLAEMGVTFTRAHAPGVFCAPSRTAIFTGRHASTTGCYSNEIFHVDRPELVTLQMAFKRSGYRTFGAGKLYHHMPGFIDLRGWDEYFTRSQEVKDMGWQMNGYLMDDAPLPAPYPYSPWYRETDRRPTPGGFLEWGPIADDREEKMVDTIRTKWACEVLRREHEKPFFLALGLYTPHFPNYAPKKYFDLYDPEKIELPSYKKDDLDDLPAAVRKRFTNRGRIHKELAELGAVCEAVRGYLAAVSYGDAMLGRVLDALENSPHRDNTILVVWSDHGYHHGEKGQWGKHTLWERTSHVPFLWAGPGVSRNAKVDATVSLIDMYATFVDLCGLPRPDGLEGTSLARVLRDPSTAADRNVLLPHMERGSYAVMNCEWRYIRYADGGEELYDVRDDPHEWTNLAGDPKYADVKRRMQAAAPTSFAPNITPRRRLRLVIEGDSFRWERRTR